MINARPARSGPILSVGGFMITESTSVLGYAAGTLTTVAFVPQVIKTWRSRSAGDLSLGMFALFATGVLLWLLYGIALGALPIIIANGTTLALALVILAFKLRYPGA